MRREAKKAQDMCIIRFRLHKEKQMRACLQYAALFDFSAYFRRISAITRFVSLRS